MIRHALMMVATLVLASACSVLPERVPVDLYQLPPSSLAASSGTTLDGGLRLARPSTSDALGGNRLLILTDNHSFQAYPAARWAAPIPHLWRDWLMDAFWRDGRVSELSASSEGLQARLELSGMLRALHIESIDGQPHAVVRFDAQLVDVRGRNILASQRFEVTQRTRDDSVTAAIRAMGEAADQLAAQLIEWTIRSAD